MTSSDELFRHRHVTVAGSRLHVVEAGEPDAVPFLFLHGWPESWQSWREMMTVAARQARAIAIDLPGIGGSTGAPTDGSKQELAAVVHGLVSTMDRRDVRLVGHDIGGMIAYSYLRTYDDIAAAVIMDVVVPGLDPWDEVLGNPRLWHFALHAVPSLPERLVHGRQEEYFGFFYDLLSHDKTRITAEARAEYRKAYASDSALTAGFNWYRAFPRDVEANRHSAAGSPVSTPLLYLRGEHEFGDIKAYVRGLKAAGMASVELALVPNAGHFAPEEAPAETWELIARFAGR